MKKRILAVLMAVTLCITCFANLGFESRAEDASGDTVITEVGSTFGMIDALIGEGDCAPCGVYLASGHSIINKISSTKVGAGGITNAALRCKVSTNAILEKLSGGSWVRVTSWTTTVQSGFTAMVDETKVVTTGYYYRVRCVHSAATDASSSYTSNLWM